MPGLGGRAQLCGVFDVLGLDDEDYVFGDVRRVIRHAFQVLGDEDQIHSLWGDRCVFRNFSEF